MKALLTTLMFAIVLTPFASAQKTASKSASDKSMKATGTVVSSSDSSLVVSGKSKKETTYVVNTDTKTTGTLTPGAKVTVEYKMDGANRVATAVTASGAGASTSASAKTGTKTGATSTKKSKT